MQQPLDFTETTSSASKLYREGDASREFVNTAVIIQTSLT